ncbi:MoaD/ThiS family protein [Methylacidimicrobium sp. B4]|uniref:MoaD/ThiS family protein n=1 Tax=Methylacidimicrobium sp. B4 TaxID=2796139 RepID=UPI001A8DC50A|nr:MoaD/ThiS family protein [Methylacidimicrobium sp. B4]QSR85329.1 MoaD/ThiS family protein [Methylacidimicrobium sp. B4]
MSKVSAAQTIPVRIPTPLRGLTGNKDQVSARGQTIGELLQDLQAQFPGIGERLFDQTGALRRFVAVYVNGEDIRFLKDQETPVGPEDEVSIVPAVAGG